MVGTAYLFAGGTLLVGCLEISIVILAEFEDFSRRDDLCVGWLEDCVRGESTPGEQLCTWVVPVRVLAGHRQTFSLVNFGAGRLELSHQIANPNARFAGPLVRNYLQLVASWATGEGRLSGVEGLDLPPRVAAA